jgi:hypothetical protein
MRRTGRITHTMELVTWRPGVEGPWVVNTRLAPLGWAAVSTLVALAALAACWR